MKSNLTNDENDLENFILPPCTLSAEDEKAKADLANRLAKLPLLDGVI